MGPALRGLLSSSIRKHFLVAGMCISILLAAHNPQVNSGGAEGEEGREKILGGREGDE